MVFKVPLSAFIVIVIGVDVEVFSLQINASSEHYRLRRQASCKHGEFSCNNGACISSYDKCDGAKQCGDGSDETAAVCRAPGVACPLMSFECSYGACVDERLRCDGKPDCADGSDEYGCPQTSPDSSHQTSSCGNAEFRCNDGQCINAYDICDGLKNCNDGSDESRDVCWNYDCPLRSFKCAYGACVDPSLKCNGFADCVDGSDEPNSCPRPTTTRRPTTRPPTIRPQTTRGPPVHPTVHPTTSPVTQPSSLSAIPDAGSCKLPVHPKNGAYISRVTQCTSNDLPACRNTPGTIVPSNWAIKYTCNSGYNLNRESEFSFCENGVWRNPVDCIKLCPPLTSLSVNVKCYFRGAETNCSEPMRLDTRATAECKPHYRHSSLPEYASLACLGNGEWSYPLFYCTPDCGVPYVSPKNELDNRISSGNAASPGQFPWLSALYYLNSLNRWEQKCGGTLITPHIVLTECGLSSLTKGNRNPVPLISNGTPAKVGEFPWLAAIYRKSEEKWDQQCGGTLITPHIVVTAAHCLVNNVLENKVIKTTDVKVGLGKYYRSYYKEEVSSITADVKEVVIPRQYFGSTSLFARDIGLLDLVISVQVTATVMPACVDWSGAYQPDSDAVGMVAGWGRTSDGGVSSEVALSARLKYIKYEECLRKLTAGNRYLLTHDKFCAGDIDGSQVNRGDSGGGLTFLNDNKYFLVGIVSTRIPGFSDFSLFLNIRNKEHSTWLEMEKNRLRQSHRQL